MKPFRYNPNSDAEHIQRVLLQPRARTVPKVFVHEPTWRGFLWSLLCVAARDAIERGRKWLK